MWFHFFVGNHDDIGRKSISDTMEWLIGGLTELRHTVTIGDTIAPNAMNLIYENFRDSDEQLFIDNAFNFGLIATEIPTGNTFNFLDAEPWRTRRRAFDKIARRANFIWSFVEEPVSVYQNWAPSGYLELGFQESVVDPVFSRDPEFDFGYYGLEITGHRRSVLKRLSPKLKIVTPDRFLVGSELNKFIASFRVGICLKHSPDWTVPSPGRISRLLHAKRGIAAEYVPVRTRASAFASMAGKDQDFLEYCLDCVSGPWRQRAEEAYEAYRAAMPMKDIIARLLDETLAARTSAGPILATADNRLRKSFGFAGDLPHLLFNEGGYNVVRYAGRIYALAVKLGPVDLTKESPESLARQGSMAIVADTVDDVRERLAQLPRSIET